MTQGGLGGDDFGTPALGPERSGAPVVVGLLLLLSVLAVAGYTWATREAGVKLASGTTVEGIDLGGLEPGAAELRLRTELAGRTDDPVDLVVAGAAARRTPQQLGLSVDYRTSVDRVSGGPRWLPGALWDYYTGGERTDALVRVDRSVLNPVLDDLVADAEREPREGEVLFTATGFRTVEPISGRVLDREAALEQLRARWLDAGPVEMPLVTAAPDIDQADVDRAVRTFATPAVSAPLQLQLGRETVTMRRQDYTDLLTTEPRDGALAAVLNAERLAPRVTEVLRRAGALPTPRDARIVLVDGRPRVRPARPGRAVRVEPTRRRVLAALAESGDGRTVRVPTSPSAADLTTRGARRLRVERRVAEVSIGYPAAGFRDTNLARAADRLDGALLLPGDALSFNDVVGPPTPERGFTSGPLRDDGQSYAGVGAGLSRLSTALFKATWDAGLATDQRTPMPWHLGEYPLGLDAAVRFGSYDLVVSNPSPYGVLVSAEATTRGARSVTVRLYSAPWRQGRTETSPLTDRTPPSTEYDATRRCVPQTGQPGFDVTVTRTLVTPAGRPQGREQVSTSYRPAATIVCVGE